MKLIEHIVCFTAVTVSIYTIHNTSSNWKRQRVNKGDIIEMILYPELDRDGQEYNTDKNCGSDKSQLYHCVDV